MRRRRPDDRQAVAPGDQKQPLADRRRAIVARAQLAPFDFIAEPLKFADPPLKLLAFAQRTRPRVVAERPPSRKLLDILQKNNARAHLPGPTNHDPGQVADAFLDRLAALGLGKMFTVRRRPQHADRLAGADIERVDLPNIVRQMQRVGMVRSVHRQRHRIVIDCDVRRNAERPFNTR